MQRYIVAENLRRFRILLETERAPDKRRLLEALVGEEEAKLRRLDDADIKPETDETGAA